MYTCSETMPAFYFVDNKLVCFIRMIYLFLRLDLRSKEERMSQMMRDQVKLKFHNTRAWARETYFVAVLNFNCHIFILYMKCAIHKASNRATVLFFFIEHVIRIYLECLMCTLTRLQYKNADFFFFFLLERNDSMNKQIICLLICSSLRKMNYFWVKIYWIDATNEFYICTNVKRTFELSGPFCKQINWLSVCWRHTAPIVN